MESGRAKIMKKLRCLYNLSGRILNAFGWHFRILIRGEMSSDMRLRYITVSSSMEGWMGKPACSALETEEKMDLSCLAD